MWIVYLLEFVIVLIVALLWVNGIASMHEEHPEYKGNGEGFNLDDEDDNTKKNKIK